MKLPFSKLFVTGIDTGIGKTVASAIITKALGASYWKPVQCGDLDQSDTQTVANLAKLKENELIAERYRLQQASSPHAAAANESLSISLESFKLPDREKIVVEGAGGTLVPLNHKHFVIDLIAHLSLPVVVVTKHYLGSLNHTFLTIEALKNRGIPILGLIFNGPEHPEYEAFIAEKTELPILLNIKDHDQLTPSLIAHYAKQFQENNSWT